MWLVNKAFILENGHFSVVCKQDMLQKRCVRTYFFFQPNFVRLKLQKFFRLLAILMQIINTSTPLKNLNFFLEIEQKKKFVDNCADALD